MRSGSLERIRFYEGGVTLTLSLNKKGCFIEEANKIQDSYSSLPVRGKIPEIQKRTGKEAVENPSRSHNKRLYWHIHK